MDDQRRFSHTIAHLEAMLAHLDAASGAFDAIERRVPGGILDRTDIEAGFRRLKEIGSNILREEKIYARKHAELKT